MKADDVLKARSEMFGINDLKKGETVIKHHTVWNDASCPFKVKTIELNDLDEIKHYIGNENNHFLKGVLKQSSNMDLAATIKEITPENVHNAANAYVYGNSKPLQHLKGQIEKVICPITVHVAEEDKIVISEPLVIDPGSPKQLIANQIVFQDKGEIICYGVLGITAGAIVNTKTE